MPAQLTIQPDALKEAREGHQSNVLERGSRMQVLPPSDGRLVAIYGYNDEHGTLLFQVVRYEPKRFEVRRPDGSGGWIWNLEGVHMVLYRLPDVLKANTVVIVEGEKDAETAFRLGLPDGWVATCNPFGAGQWRSEYSEVLRGKQVFICPDADEYGRQHLLEVCRDLAGKAAEIWVIALPTGPKDLTEWSEAGGTPEQFVQLLLGARRFVSP